MSWTLPRQEAYKQAAEEILDIPGLAKLRAVMEKYNLSYVIFDHNLNISAKRMKHYGPSKDKRDDKTKSS